MNATSNAKVLEAVARLEEVKKSVEAKMALRQSNLNPARPDAGLLRTLDSSIKRNSAVIKKLKQINEETHDALMDELRGVNLSKIVSEAVASICDAKLRSSDIQAAVQFFKGLNITTDQKKAIRKACYSFYDAAAELVQSEHSSLRLMDHENSKILNAKGELRDENIASYEKLRKYYDQLYRNLSSLAEALDKQPPVMPEDAHTTRVNSGEEAISSGAGKDSPAAEPIWDDEDTMTFYECLPDIRAFVPAVLLGETELTNSEQSVKSQRPTN